MDDTKHKKRDKKDMLGKKHGERGGIDDPQQALGLLRAHLEDIRNACGVYTGWSCPTCWSAVARCWHSMRRARFGRQWSRRQKALEHLRNSWGHRTPDVGYNADRSTAISLRHALPGTE
jgi:hypothetical protein